MPNRFSDGPKDRDISQKSVIPPEGLRKVGRKRAGVGMQPLADRKSKVEDVIDLLKPSPPEQQADLDFRMEGPVWVLSLNNDQTNQLLTIMRGPSTGSGFADWLIRHGIAAATAALPVIGQIANALSVGADYIDLINQLGGHNGVDINGVIGTLGIIVTPRVGKVYGQLIEAARTAVSGRTILDFLVMASARVPALAGALNIPVVAAVYNAVASGTPLGWAVAGALGFAVELLQPEPDPNAHGAVHADRDQALEWESFHLGQLGFGNTVALLSWQGFFSAQGGGGSGVYANRPEIREWETWTLIDNHDGTVSFRTFNGHFLCAEMGGGDVCQANRTAIGDWERFYMVSQPDGRIALATHDKGKYLSVQANS